MNLQDRSLDLDQPLYFQTSIYKSLKWLQMKTRLEFNLYCVKKVHNHVGFMNTSLNIITLLRCVCYLQQKKYVRSSVRREKKVILSSNLCWRKWNQSVYKAEDEFHESNAKAYGIQIMTIQLLNPRGMSHLNMRWKEGWSYLWCWWWWCSVLHTRTGTWAWCIT